MCIPYIFPCIQLYIDLNVHAIFETSVFIHMTFIGRPGRPLILFDRPSEVELSPYLRLNLKSFAFLASAQEIILDTCSRILQARLSAML